MTSSCLSRQNGCKIPATAVAVTAVVAVWCGCHVLSLRMWLWRRQGDCHLYQSKPWGIVVIAVAIVICCCWWSLMTVFQSVFLFYPYTYNIHFRTIYVYINFYWCRCYQWSLLVVVMFDVDIIVVNVFHILRLSIFWYHFFLFVCFLFVGVLSYCLFFFSMAILLEIFIRSLLSPFSFLHFFFILTLFILFYIYFSKK